MPYLVGEFLIFHSNIRFEGYTLELSSYVYRIISIVILSAVEGSPDSTNRDPSTALRMTKYSGCTLDCFLAALIAMTRKMGIVLARREATKQSRRCRMALLSSTNCSFEKGDHSGWQYSFPGCATNDKTFIFEINLAESQVYISPMQRIG